MGLSLVELAIGRYPIPSPKQEDIDEIFRHPPDGPPVVLPNTTTLPGARSPAAGAGGAAGETKSMAIFELLDYIVNEVNFLVVLFKLIIFCSQLVGLAFTYEDADLC